MVGLSYSSVLKRKFVRTNRQAFYFYCPQQGWCLKFWESSSVDFLQRSVNTPLPNTFPKSLDIFIEFSPMLLMSSELSFLIQDNRRIFKCLWFHKYLALSCWPIAPVLNELIWRNKISTHLKDSRTRWYAQLTKEWYNKRYCLTLPECGKAFLEKAISFQKKLGW